MLLFVIIFLAFVMVFVLKTPPSTYDASVTMYYKSSVDIESEKQRLLNSWKESCDFSFDPSDIAFRIDVYLQPQNQFRIPVPVEGLRQMTFKNVVEIKNVINSEYNNYKVLILKLRLDRHSHITAF